VKPKGGIRLAKSAVIYIRVSTEEQARDAYGLESQERACREFCQERGWAVREVFRDAGVSGWADVERPGFQRMMQRVREDRDVNVVFFDYSRFGRKVLPALQAFKKLDGLGVFSVAVNNFGIDCRTAPGSNREARRTQSSRRFQRSTL
jgi:site-specific DNA recombinase